MVPDEIATDLGPFRAALAGAGLAVGTLGAADGYLHTYDADGAVVDLPQAMRDQIRTAVAAYTPPARPDFGNDEPPADYRAQAVQAVQQLRAYLALAAPTQAQNAAAIRVMARVLLVVIRYVLLPPERS
jgi:hypothetical protein